MEKIENRIGEMRTEELIEATQMVANQIINGADTSNIETELEKVLANPATHIAEVEEFCRVFLFEAADSETYRQIVIDAINNTGKKNFVMSGMEIVLLAAVIVAGIRVIRNPPTKVTEIKEKGKIFRETTYNPDSSFMDKMMDLFKRNN